MLIRFLVSYLAIKLTVATVKNNAILNEDEQQKIFNGSLLDPLQDIKYDEIEFLETPLSFQQEQMYTALSSGEQFSRAELYVLKLNFLHSRVKTPNIYFRNLPGYLIDNFIEKAYLSASHTQKDTKLEFENIDNIFDDENSK
ncbi:MAG TPA: hypothetical protein PLP33_14590 [Leptospiraceae bacterium]|nr:hypothetical protein [Leptospiraceae bacterium]